MTQPSSAARRRSSLYAANAALFGDSKSPILAAFEGSAESRVLRSGDVLFRKGDPGDALYVVTHGSLEVLVDDPHGGQRSLATIARGNVVGEMALLVDEPRSATVRAVRDSEVLRIARAEFEALLEKQPSLGIELARALVRRLRRASSGIPEIRRPRTVTLIAAVEADQPAVVEFARALAVALDRERSSGLALSGAIVATSETIERALGAGSSALKPGEPNEPRVVEWLSSLEDAHRFVLFCGDRVDSAWTARCIRQADLVVVVARANTDANPRALLDRVAVAATGAPARRELVLLHEANTEWPRDTSAWLGAEGIAAFHHVRPAREDDVRRFARSIAGTAIGVVLSGGGARGFAHIGVLRALRESGLPIDVIGGTSMGGVIAALWATGHDHVQIADICRRHYTSGGPSDRTLPVVAFNSGHQTVRNMKTMFGDRRAEDLWTRYFAVSSSLTEAVTRVHETGPLWLWGRVTTAIPGLTPPVTVGNELLADGGILDNLPVDAMRERCSGAVIASDASVPVDLRPLDGSPTRAAVSGWPVLWERVNPMSSAAPSLPGIMEILERTATLSAVRDAQGAARLADLYVRPPVDGYGMTSFAAIDAIVEIGYRYASERVEEWLTLRRLGMNEARG